jgi:predicted glycogen debranching enzyme
VLTLQKVEDRSGISVDTANSPLDCILEKEWLLTNTRGGFASSTVVGCNTRRYHGLLIGSLDPPVKRVLAMSNCLETVCLGPGRFNLATCEFPNTISPDGFLRLKRFSKDLGVHFYYQLGDLRLKKSVYLLRERDTVVLVYEFRDVAQSFDFLIRPLVAMRDFHSLQKANTQLIFTLDSSSSVEQGEVLIYHSSVDYGRLLLSYRDAIFEKDPQWWFNFIYRCDRERGQDFTEDLFSPGFFRYNVDAPTRLVLWADLSRAVRQDKSAATVRFVPPDIEYVIQQLSEYRHSIIAPAGRDKLLGTLYQAGDQFIIKRSSKDVPRTTILAGFPWFADWGRDAFISLTGLLLATRRFAEAKSVLLSFSKAANQGLIPNYFDDYTDTAHFNSVDASLWFISAAFAYLAATGDRRTFNDQFLPSITSIIDSYQKGVLSDIRVDKDGLIIAGDPNSQLTWMDAKYNGVAFTPRNGKPVEVNALWYNALMLLVQYLADSGGANEQLLSSLRTRVNNVRESFCRLFWNESWGWLNDCIRPDGTVDATLRPNQIFAVALPFSPLEPARQKAVVAVVEKKLLTPFGLRSLPPDDCRYQGVYTGGQQQRDQAYHQGTVWPYLLGPFVEAYLKVNGFSPMSKKQAFRFIEPLLKHLTENGCIGQVSEIFDGNPPHRPKGCFAQAWSVAELIQAYLLIKY